MRLLRLSALAVAALVPSCTGGLGDFCQTDDDCAADLRCSGDGVTRGVCVLPAAMPDAGSSAERTLPGDSAPPDTAQPDAAADLAAGRDSNADGPASDGPTADGAANDGPDARLGDALATD